jgi:hypothetical protein
MDSPKDEGDGTGGNGISGANQPTGWRAWSLERVLVLAGFVAVVIADIILGRTIPSLVGILLLLLLPGFISTGLLLWRPRSVYYLIAGLANSVLALGAIPFGLLASLANPLLGPVYVAAILISLAAVLALPAGVLGYLRSVAGRAEQPLAQGIRSPHGLAALIVVGLCLGAIAAGSLAYQSASLPPPTTPSAGSDLSRSTNVSILASGSRFSPGIFNVTAFVVTRIIIFNEDSALHTFTYVSDGITYSHDLPGPGTTTQFFVLFYGPGLIPYRSTALADAQMNGTIRVLGAPPYMNVNVSKSGDGTNWILLVSSTTPGEIYSSTTLAIFKADGSSNLTAMALDSLSPSNHGCTLSKITPGVSAIQVGDRILCKTGWYLSGSRWQISDGATLLATGRFQ